MKTCRRWMTGEIVFTRQPVAFISVLFFSFVVLLSSFRFRRPLPRKNWRKKQQNFPAGRNETNRKWAHRPLALHFSPMKSWKNGFTLFISCRWHRPLLTFVVAWDIGQLNIFLYQFQTSSVSCFRGKNDNSLGFLTQIWLIHLAEFKLVLYRSIANSKLYQLSFKSNSIWSSVWWRISQNDRYLYLTNSSIKVFLKLNISRSCLIEFDWNTHHSIALAAIYNIAFESKSISWNVIPQTRGNRQDSAHSGFSYSRFPENTAKQLTRST